MTAPQSGTASVRKAIEFLHIELASLADGGISLSVTATTVDDEEPQLLHQEIASERVPGVEEALDCIRCLVRANM